MRKSDLIKDVSQKVQQPESQVGAVVNATFSAIQDALSEGQDVSIAGFGTFRISERSAREGRNPQTGQRITIPARKSPGFKPGTQLKRAVAGESEEA
ncbi:MAG TPA: HU family DNA-binding protein [Nitrolancea sp.]|nr:HU family DNA-binding protein [Nitrolancea sp.]